MNANLRVGSTNSKLLDSAQAIKLFRVTDGSTLTSVLNSISSLSDTVLNSESSIEVVDSTFYAVGKIRFANIKIASKPLRFILSKINFIGSNDVITIA